VATAQCEVEQIVTAVHQMAATVQDVARNAESAASAASEADSAALYSQQKAKDAVNMIGELAETIEQSNMAMGRLKNETGNIGGVLEVIKSVADQTNLLALNRSHRSCPCWRSRTRLRGGSRRGTQPGTAYPEGHLRD